jgi:2-methylisocitrate lyase-like PEP mutase family enzyme
MRRTRIVAEAPMTSQLELARRCDRLRSLHRPGTPLVLPNAWDVSSALEVVAAGFPAVATTSAGVAASLGYSDHQGAPAAEMLAVAGRIARSVEVPVSVDAEAGYGMEPAELVDALLAAGAAGCNLEDTDHDAGGLAELTRNARWLRAVRDAADARGYGLVINARIDVFLAGRSAPPTREVLDDGIARGRAYLAAGADCVFPIVLWAEDAIAELTAAVGGPVNVMALPQAPPIARLAELGVARVSYGSMTHAHAMRALAGLLAEIAGSQPD